MAVTDERAGDRHVALLMLRISLKSLELIGRSYPFTQKLQDKWLKSVRLQVPNQAPLEQKNTDQTQSSLSQSLS
jgi:hypothetical protein